jgi:hypothetical protein
MMVAGIVFKMAVLAQPEHIGDEEPIIRNSDIVQPTQYLRQVVSRNRSIRNGAQRRLEFKQHNGSLIARARLDDADAIWAIAMVVNCAQNAPNCIHLACEEPLHDQNMNVLKDSTPACCCVAFKWRSEPRLRENEIRKRCEGRQPRNGGNLTPPDDLGAQLVPLLASLL